MKSSITKLTAYQDKYICSMLHRTKHKKFEHDYLSKLYDLLLFKYNIILEFRTQQTVFRHNAKNSIAYLDGFFPELNFVIEIDEQYHKYQKDKDLDRQNDICKELSKYYLNIEPEVFRFDVTKDKYSQLYECAERIQELYIKHNKPKWLEPIDIVKRDKCIKFNKNLIFKYKHDLLNVLGLKPKNISKQCFTIHGTQNTIIRDYDEQHQIWFPSLKDNKYIGWLNTYDNKNNIFSTKCIKNTNRLYFKTESSLFKNNKLKNRYIIFNCIDPILNIKGFKYFGEFECIEFNEKKQISKWKQINTNDLKIIC